MSDGLWNEIQGKWEQVAGQAKQRWGELTNDELLKVEGNRDELIGLVKERYGIAQQEAAEQVNEWAEEMKEHDKPEHKK